MAACRGKGCSSHPASFLPSLKSEARPRTHTHTCVRGAGMNSEVQNEADKDPLQRWSSRVVSAPDAGHTGGGSCFHYSLLPLEHADASACVKLPPSLNAGHGSPWEMLCEESLCCVFQLEEEDPDRGQPCMRCGDQCPGFRVHGWRYEPGGSQTSLLPYQQVFVFNDELRCSGDIWTDIIRI